MRDGPLKKLLVDGGEGGFAGEEQKNIRAREKEMKKKLMHTN